MSLSECAARRRARRCLPPALAVALLATLASCREEAPPPAARIAAARKALQPKPGEKVRVVPQGGPLAPRRISFAPLGSPRLAVVEADGTVSVWLVDRPRRPRCFAWIYTDAFEAVFSADGETILTAGRDGAISLWSVAGKLRRRIPDVHRGGVRALAIGAELLVSGGVDGTVRLWNADASPRGAALTGHRGAVLSVALSPQGQVASFGIDQSLRLWSPGPDGTYRETAVLNLENPRFSNLLPNLLRLDVNWGWGRAVAFAPSGELLAVAPFDATVRVLRSDGTAVGEALQGHGGKQAQSVAFAADGSQLVSAGHDGKLQMWLPDGRLTELGIQAHDAPAVGVDQSKQGALIASAGTDGVVSLWDSTGKRLGQLPRRHDSIRAMAVDRGAAAIAVGDARGEIWLWDRDARRRGPPIREYDREVAAMAFSPAGDLLASGCADNAVCVWQAQAESVGGLLASSTGVRRAAHDSRTSAVAFAARGNGVASGTDYGSLLLWKEAPAASAAPLEGARGIVTAIAFSPTGTLIAAASEVVRLWKLDRSWRSEGIEGHGGLALAVAFSPRGDVLASSGVDGLVRLWRSDGTALGEPLGAHAGAANALAFASGGELISGGDDGKLRIWNIEAGSSRQIDVGPPIVAVGRAGALTWAITRRDEIHFYGSDEIGAAERLVATMLFAPGSALLVRSDGSYSGEGDLAKQLLAFTAGGRQVLLPEPSAGSAGAFGVPPPAAADGGPR